MALAHGLNGTFAPVYEYIEEIPKKDRFTKKVFANGVWEDRLFIIINDDSDRNEVQRWLKEHYGKQVYGQTWWSTFSSTCMWDKIFVHWKLMQ